MSASSRAQLAGGVRVNVTHAGLCGTDLQRLAGPPAPTLQLGHEIAGVVTSAAPSYPTILSGDRVAVMPLLPCFVCANCSAGNTNLCTRGHAIGRTHPGGFRGVVDVPASNCVRLPKEMSLDVAAMADVVAVCAHAINAARVSPADRCLVIGDGAIGLVMCLLLAPISAEVALVGRHAANLDLARELTGRAVKSMPTGPEPRFEHVFETVGRRSASSMTYAVESVAPSGLITVLGVFAAGYAPPLVVRNLFIKEASIRGTNAYTAPEFQAAVASMADPGLAAQLSALITHRFSIDQFDAGVGALRHKQGLTVKVMFQFER